MRSKVTIVLLFLNVVLFFYIFKYEQVVLPDASGRRVFGAEVQTITSLTRTMNAAPTVRLNLDTTKGNTWWLTQPYDWPAAPNAVASLLNELQFLEHETSFPVADLEQTGQSLAEFGLADPTTTLTFVSAGKDYTVRLGKETEVGNRLYVLSTDGTRIHVVRRNFADSLRKPLHELRANSVFTIPVFEVRSLNVQTAPPANLKIRLRRDSTNRWGFESPMLARASKTNVEVTINQLNALNPKRFLEPRETDLDRDGLTTPALRVTLEGNSRRETLLIGNEVPPSPAPANTSSTPNASAPEKEYFAKIEDKNVVFTTTITDALLKVLRASQETLRDPRVLEFEPNNVNSVTVTVPGQPEISLQRLETPDRNDFSWQVVTRNLGQTPTTSAADSKVVTNLLLQLYQLAARKFISDAPSDSDIENYGFNRPEREITLSLNPSGTDPTIIVLQIGVSPDQPGRAYARTKNEQFLYEILPDIIDRTPPAPYHYRQRTLRELPANARVTALRITELPSDTSVISASHETALTTESIAELSVSANAREALGSLLASLRTLTAKNFTGESFNAQQVETSQGPRPWKYKLEMDFVLPGGGTSSQATTSTLYFTERLGGTTTLAGTADFGGVVFELTQDMADALFALTYAEKNDPGIPEVPAPKDAETPATNS
jgi:hypothetical protein